MADKQSMIFYYEWLEDFAEMSIEEVGLLVTAILKYDQTGEDTDFKDRSLRVMFRRMKRQCDENQEKYQERCEKNRENIKKRWDNIRSNTNVYEPIRSDTNYTDSDSDNEYDNEYDNDSELCNAHTREEIHAYFREQGFRSDPDRFIDYNVGKGNNIFKYRNQWKAVARNWEKKEKDFHPPDRFELLDKIIAGEVTYDDVSGSS